MKTFNDLLGTSADYSVDDIFKSINDYDEVLVLIDDGDIMYNLSGPTRDDAKRILDYVKDGCKVECQVYFDSDGNNISDDEARSLNYFDDNTILSIQPDDDHIEDDFVGDTSKMINFPNIGRKLNKNEWVESRLCKVFCERFNIECHIKDYDLYNKISPDCKISDKDISVFNDALHIDGNAVKRYLKNSKYSRVTVSIRDGECELFLRSNDERKNIDLGLRWTRKTDLSSFLPKLVQKVIDTVKML